MSKTQPILIFASNLHGLHVEGIAGALFSKTPELLKSAFHEPKSTQGLYNHFRVKEGFTRGMVGCSYALPYIVPNTAPELSLLEAGDMFDRVSGFISRAPDLQFILMPIEAKNALTNMRIEHGYARLMSYKNVRNATPNEIKALTTPY
jgi:hypothetical protein